MDEIEVRKGNSAAIFEDKDVSALDLTDLSEYGTSLIQFWSQVERARTDVLRRLADVVVQARSQHLDENGLPDWAGRTWQYRVYIGEMYSSAGIPEDSADGVQASLRYHVGNRLREVASPSELEAVGLLASSPKTRSLRPKNDPLDPIGELKSKLTQLRPQEALQQVETLISDLEDLREELQGDDG